MGMRTRKTRTLGYSESRLSTIACTTAFAQCTAHISQAFTLKVAAHGEMHTGDFGIVMMPAGCFGCAWPDAHGRVWRSQTRLRLALLKEVEEWRRLGWFCQTHVKALLFAALPMFRA